MRINQIIQEMQDSGQLPIGCRYAALGVLEALQSAYSKPDNDGLDRFVSLCVEQHSGFATLPPDQKPAVVTALKLAALRL